MFVLYLSEVLLEIVLPSVISVAFTLKILGLLVLSDVTDDFESLTKWFILK